MKLLNKLFVLLILSTLLSCGSSDTRKRARLAELVDSAWFYADHDLRDKSAICCAEGIKLAIELKDDSARAVLESATGRNLYAVENYDASIMHFENAIRLIGYPKSARGVMARALFFTDIAQLHRQIMDYEIAFAEFDSAKVNVLESFHRDKNINNEFNTDSLIGRISIQQAKSLYNLGQHSKASVYLDVFLKTNYAKSYEGQSLYCDHLIQQKKYEEARNILIKLQEEHKEFVPSATAMAVSSNLAWVHYLLGNYKESYDEYDNYELLRHNRQKSLTNNQMIFQCNNVEKQIYRLDTALEREKADMYFVCLLIASGLCVFFFISLYIVWRRHRNYIKYESFKQHYSQPMYIDEEYLTAKIKEVLGDAKTQNKLDKKSKEELAAIAAKEIKEETYKKNAANSFIEAVKTNNLYLDPDFKREVLITELNLRKSSFNADFESVTGESPANFIQRLRLEYAAKLLIEENNFTVDAIAYESGFTSRSTFYRIFADLYGMSPAEYRAKNQNKS